MPRRRHRRFSTDRWQEGDLSHWEVRSDLARQEVSRPRDSVRSQASRVRLRGSVPADRRKVAVRLSLSGVLRARRAGVQGAVARARSELEAREVVARSQSFLGCVRQHLREMRERQGSGGVSPRRTRTRNEVRREIFAAARRGC